MKFHLKKKINEKGKLTNILIENNRKEFVLLHALTVAITVAVKKKLYIIWNQVTYTQTYLCSLKKVWDGVSERKRMETSKVSNKYFYSNFNQL